MTAAFAGLSVGLVGPLPPPAGGMAMQTQQLAEMLRGAGARVELVQTNAPYAPTWIGRVPVVRALARLLPYLWALWRTAGRVGVFHVMANSGWSWHLFAAPAIWVARMRGVAVIVNYRGGEAEAFLARQVGLVRRSMDRAAALIVPSAFLQEVFARHGLLAQVVPNIVDLARFRPLPDGQAREPRVLVARNLEPIYDNATALRAFARVVRQRPQVRLTIAGTGPLAGELHALARELEIADNVDFAGRLGRDEVAAALRCSAVSLNPSRVDNMPNSVLEALASGTPVVSTRVGGVPYIVRDEDNALLVPAGDDQAMAAAILRLLDDAALARRLIDSGLREVRRYTWSSIAPILAETYRRAASTPSPLSACTRD